MKQNIKVVLFDLDDTLFDRSRAQSIILEGIVRRFPDIFGALEMGRVTTAFEKSDRLAVAAFDAGVPSHRLREMRSRMFLRLLGLQEDFADQITSIYVRDYPAIKAPVAGAASLVKTLSWRLPVEVVTNGFPDVQYRKLETIGLRSLFSCVVLSEEVGIRKPDPTIFHHAASLLKTQPHDCLYVGDSYANDVIGAKRARMQACWSSREQSVYDDEEIRADFVVSRLRELARIVGKEVRD